MAQHPNLSRQTMLGPATTRPAGWIAPLGRPALTLVASLALAGCATTGPDVPAPVPEEELPALEARLAANPQSEELQLRTTASLLAAGRCEEAVDVAARVPATPEDAWPVLTRGYCFERRGAWDEARSVYEGYLGRFDQGGGVPAVRGRLEWVRERSAADRARRRVARGPAGTPSPTTTAVLPVEMRGDPELAYVGPALTDLLRSDLNLVDGIDVVDPWDLDALLDELSRSGSLPDSLLPGDVGALAGAGRLVRGVTHLDELTAARLDAAIRTADGGTATAGERRGGLDELAALQKQLSFAVIQELGLAITVAERNRILNNGTGDTDALMAYAMGRDLHARGEDGEAALWFGRATRYDPDFRQARIALETVVGAEVARRTRAGDLLASVSVTRTRVQQQVQAARTGPTDPLRMALISGTGDVAATQGEQILGAVGRIGQEGAVGSIQGIEATPLLSLARVRGVIRVIVLVPGG